MIQKKRESTNELTSTTGKDYRAHEFCSVLRLLLGTTVATELTDPLVLWCFFCDKTNDGEIQSPGQYQTKLIHMRC